jgi:hypothetical protein
MESPSPFEGGTMPSTHFTNIGEAKKALEDFEKELKGFHPVKRTNIKNAIRLLGNKNPHLPSVEDYLQPIMGNNDVPNKVFLYCRSLRNC